MRDDAWNETDNTDNNDDDGQTTGALDTVADVAFHAWVARPVIAGVTGMALTAVAAPLAPLAMPLAGLIDGLFTDDQNKVIVDRVTLATTACRFGGDLYEETLTGLGATRAQANSRMPGAALTY